MHIAGCLELGEPGVHCQWSPGPNCHRQSPDHGLLDDLFLNLDRPDWFVGALQGLLGEDVYESVIAHMGSRL